jgi:hypothetical protein
VGLFRTHMQALAGNDELSSDLRGRAGRLLAILAEETGDERLGQQTLESIRDIDSSHIDAAVARLIHETGFGSPENARALAKKLYASAHEQPADEAKLRGLSTAAIALWRCGEIAPSMTACREAYDLSKKNRVWSACTAYATMLADMHWGLGDSAEAASWLGRSAEHAARPSGMDRGYSLLGTRIRLALEAGDVLTADELLRTAEKMYPRLLVNRMGLERLAYRIQIELAAGRDLDPDLVRELTEGHIDGRGGGLHDMIADTVVAALKATGKHDQAESVRHEYVTVYRKDAFPVPVTLANLRPETGSAR